MPDAFVRLSAAVAGRYTLERELGYLGQGRSARPAVLFAGPYPDSPGWTRPRGYDVSSDGSQFLMIKQPPERERPRVNVVLHWSDELRAKVPR